MAQLLPEDYHQILSKFLLNLPKEELEDSARLSYHAQKAFYYYLDIVLKDKESKDWKKQRKDFFNNLKDHAPPFLKINPTLLSDKLMENKPVCGAIVFNRQNSKVLVIRVGDKLGFPKGKLNQGETLEECAIRQVEEQTGINLTSKIDPKIRIQFFNHEGKINFFIGRGVAEEERIRIDSNEIDEVLWMKVEDIKRDLSSKFAERSKIAWAIYDKDYAGKSSSEMFIPKYYKKDSENLDFSIDPLRSFKLDHKKLSSIIYDQ